MSLPPVLPTTVTLGPGGVPTEPSKAEQGTPSITGGSNCELTSSFAHHSPAGLPQIYLKQSKGRCQCKEQVTVSLPPVLPTTVLLGPWGVSTEPSKADCEEQVTVQCCPP